MLPRFARARDSARTVIQGPEHLGPVIAAGDEFQLPHVALARPQSDGTAPCRVTVTVKTKGRVQVGTRRKKTVTLGWVTYDAELDGAREPLERVPLSQSGKELLERLGTVSAQANVTVSEDDPIARDFKLMLTSV
jgi:hypothetical protein